MAPATMAYPIFLYLDEDGDIVARIPLLRGCAAHGATVEAALATLEEAAQLWIADAQACGDPVPVPPQITEGGP